LQRFFSVPAAIFYRIPVNCHKINRKNCYFKKEAISTLLYTVEISELNIPYNTVVAADFADSEYEASAKSRYSERIWSARVL